MAPDPSPAVFADAGLQVEETVVEGVYDRYIVGEGEYPLTVFLGRKG